MSFADRAVLVVGGLGFIGGRLSSALADVGARVTVVTPSRQKHHETAIDLEARGIRIVDGDVRDRRAMESSVRGQDVVFNLAGQSGAVRSMEQPLDDLDVNARGMLTLVEAVRRENPAARVVFTGSRLEYGRVGSDPVAETHDTEPMCLHAVHKLVGEQYLRLYERLFGLSYVVARITNPYGPGQPQSRTAYGVVNRLIHLALAGETLPIYGDGRQRRDYIYRGRGSGPPGPGRARPEKPECLRGPQHLQRRHRRRDVDRRHGDGHHGGGRRRPARVRRVAAAR